MHIAGAGRAGTSVVAANVYQAFSLEPYANLTQPRGHIQDPHAAETALILARAAAGGIVDGVASMGGPADAALCVAFASLRPLGGDAEATAAAGNFLRSPVAVTGLLNGIVDALAAAAGVDAAKIRAVAASFECFIAITATGCVVTYSDMDHNAYILWKGGAFNRPDAGGSYFAVIQASYNAFKSAALALVARALEGRLDAPYALSALRGLELPDVANWTAEALELANNGTL
jgi:hypothetical protein